MGILGVIVGILAIVCAFFGTFLFGVAGGIGAGVLAAAAIIFGIVKRKRDGKGGIAGIVIGALAILMAFGMTNRWTAMFSEMHNRAVEYKPDGLWAQVSEDPRGGLMGIMKKMPEDESSLNALMDELEELRKLEGEQK